MSTINLHPRTITSTLTPSPYLASAATLGLLLTTALLTVYLDYHNYCSLGSHGLPGNFHGYKTQLQMSKYARKDVTVPAPYNLKDIKREYGPHATVSFLKTPLQDRKGPRPKIPGFVAPQRQVSDVASSELKEKMNLHLDALVKINGKILQRELSRLEGPVPAVQLQPSLPIPPFLQRTLGEIIHIHPPDGSTHVVLSLEDSKTVIEIGWGQRHRLSGGKMLPWNYTLIYAPRNEEEFAVWKGIVEAAAGYCCAELGKIEKMQN